MDRRVKPGDDGDNQSYEEPSPMPILPSNFVSGNASSGGVLGIPASAPSALPPWLVDAMTALKIGAVPLLTGTQAPSATQPAVPANTTLSPASGGSKQRSRPGACGDSARHRRQRRCAARLRRRHVAAASGQARATRRKSHRTPEQLAQHRRAFAAQQAAALAALQARGIPDAAALAAMHPALARVLLARVAER